MDASRATMADERSHREDRYRRMVDHMPAIVYVETEDRPFPTTFISRRVRDVLGWEPDRFLEGRTFWAEIVHPDDARAAGLADANADPDAHADAHTPYVAEYRLRDTVGAWRWFRDEAVYIAPQTGEPGYWQGLLVEITEHKDTEARLEQLQARYRDLVEQLPAATYVDAADDRMTSVYVSPQMERLLGIPAASFATEDLWEACVHPDDRAAAVEGTRAGIASGRPFTLEYRMIAADGRTVWVRDQASIVRDHQGRPAYVQGLYTDITDQKRGEEELRRAFDLERRSAAQLREADEIKTAFLTAVSHDLRTPLSAILGNAVTLSHEEEFRLTPEERQELTQSLVTSAKRLTGLVNDLLDMDRLGRGVVEPRRIPADVGELAEHMVNSSELLGGRTVHVDIRPARAWVDPAMIGRIVENLLANVAKHTAPGTPVWLRAWSDDDGVVIAVEDAGPGIPQGLRGVLFNAFERGPSPNPQSPGVGIGLSLVAKFAELHDGRAWVEDRDGGGASFRVRLPSVEPSHARASG
jgi:PAS domain S-box-containing protein